MRLISVFSQGITNGWSNINGWQVLLDSTIGALSGLVAASGFGALASAFISSGLGFAGSVLTDVIESNGEWESIDWGKAAIMGIINFGLGLWGGAGSQNTKELGKGLLNNKEVNKTFSILYNASNKYLARNMSSRGIAGVFNLYSKQLITSISKALPKIIAKLTAINLVKLSVINTLTAIGATLVNEWI